MQPLDFGAAWQEAIRELHEKEADPERNRMDAALRRADGGGEIEEARRLIAAGADMAAKDRFGETALHLAATFSHEGVVMILLEAGADVGAKDEAGDTALHDAAWDGHEGVLKMLLHKGGDVAATNKNGDTALHSAAANGRDELATMLLGAGADLFAKNNAGDTALVLAEKKGHEGVARVLRDAEAAQAASAPAGVAEVPVGALSAQAGALTAPIAGGRDDAARYTRQTLELAKMQEKKGDAEYKQLSYGTAAEAYSKAIRLTDMHKLPLPEEQQALARALKLTCLVHTLRLA